jgi:sec-independent protein translocase protein TatC
MTKIVEKFEGRPSPGPRLRTSDAEVAESLSFWDHLEELRGGVLKSLAAVVIASVLFYPFIDRVLGFLVRPVGHLVFTAPADAFVARMMLTLVGGTLCALPVVLYQVWSFVSVALNQEERKYVLLFGPLSLIMFFAGVLFAYAVAAPWALGFLMRYSSDIMVPMITVKNYISFVSTLLFSFGVVFELPLVLMFLTKIGIATPEFLIQKRRHAILLIFIVSAILTPPDAITLFILAVPLIILYEIGIWVSRWARKPI